MKPVAWTMAGALVSRGLQVVALVVLANLLAPRDMGLFAAVLVLVAIAASLGSLRLESAMVQRYHAVPPVQHRSVLATATMLTLLASLAVFVFLAAPPVRASTWLHLPTGLVLLGAAGAALRMHRNLGISMLQARLRFRRSATLTAFHGLTVLAATVGSALLFERSALAVVAGLLLAEATSTLLTFAAADPVLPRPSSLRSPHARPLLATGLLVHAASVAAVLDNSIDLFLLNILVGPAAVAVYQFAVQLAMAATLLADAAGFTTFPLLARAFSNGDLRAVRETVRSHVLALALVALAFFTLLVANVRWAVDLLLPAEYESLVVPLGVLCVALVPFVSVASVGTILTAGGRARVAILPMWMALLLNVTLCLVLIPPLGLVGAALATGSSFLLRAVATAALSARHLDAPFPVRGLAVTSALTAAFVGGILLYPVHPVVANLAAVGATVVAYRMALSAADRRRFRAVRPALRDLLGGLRKKTPEAGEEGGP